MAIEDMYAKLADVCTLNPRVSFKLLKIHGLLNKEILEFLFYEIGMVTIDEAIGVAYDSAEKQKIWRRARKASCLNGYYRVADIIKVPRQYYEILQRRDLYISVNEAVAILGVPKRTFYALLKKYGWQKNFKSEITLDMFKKTSLYIEGMHIKEVSNQLGIKKTQVYSQIQKYGITLDNNGHISWSDWENLKSKYTKTGKSCKSSLR